MRRSCDISQFAPPPFNILCRPLFVRERGFIRIEHHRGQTIFLITIWKHWLNDYINYLKSMKKSTTILRKWLVTNFRVVISSEITFQFGHSIPFIFSLKHFCPILKSKSAQYTWNYTTDRSFEPHCSSILPGDGEGREGAGNGEGREGTKFEQET